MTDLLSPRKRLVNFRVTDEEFRELRQACLACGARGISEFARQAIFEHTRRMELAASFTMEPQSTPSTSGSEQDIVASCRASLRRLIEELNTLASRFPTPEPAVDLATK